MENEAMSYSDRVKHFNEFHADEMKCLECGRELILCDDHKCESLLPSEEEIESQRMFDFLTTCNQQEE
jgi:uncharacterized protein with PIN domain